MSEWINAFFIATGAYAVTLVTTLFVLRFIDVFVTHKEEAFVAVVMDRLPPSNDYDFAVAVLLPDGSVKACFCSGRWYYASAVKGLNVQMVVSSGILGTKNYRIDEEASDKFTFAQSFTDPIRPANV